VVEHSGTTGLVAVNPSSPAGAREGTRSQANQEMKKEQATISAEEPDRRFDDGDDISDYLDRGKATRPGLQPRRVNVDLPSWTISELDKQASLIGVTRQSVITVWLSERIKTEKAALQS